MTNWHNIFVRVPADAETVWIVRQPFFDTPHLAEYTAATHTFLVTLSDTSTVALALVTVWKWRSL
jgi:hypothetical protein